MEHGRGQPALDDAVSSVDMEQAPPAGPGAGPILWWDSTATQAIRFDLSPAGR